MPKTTDSSQGTDAESKSHFRRITVTIPQSAYQVLIGESARRKIAGEPNQLLSALLREALAEYLTKLRREAV